MDNTYRIENTYKRGSICWLNDPTSYDDSYVLHGKRPVVVVSSDAVNPYSGTVIVVPLTTKTDKRLYMGQFDIILNGIRSRVRCDQIRVADKSYLDPPHAKLGDAAMMKLTENLAILLGACEEESGVAVLAED